MLGIVNKFLFTKAPEASAMTAQDVKNAMSMDTQWNSENDSGGPPLAYASLLLSKALEACGQRCIEWGRVVFPVESMQQLLDRNALVDPRLIEDPQRLLAVINCMEQGVRAVKRYYLMNMEGKAQPLKKT